MVYSIGFLGLRDTLSAMGDWGLFFAKKLEESIFEWDPRYLNDLLNISDADRNFRASRLQEDGTRYAEVRSFILAAVDALLDALTVRYGPQLFQEPDGSLGHYLPLPSSDSAASNKNRDKLTAWIDEVLVFIRENGSQTTFSPEDIRILRAAKKYVYRQAAGHQRMSPTEFKNALRKIRWRWQNPSDASLVTRATKIKQFGVEHHGRLNRKQMNMLADLEELTYREVAKKWGMTEAALEGWVTQLNRQRINAGDPYRKEREERLIAGREILRKWVMENSTKGLLTDAARQLIIMADRADKNKIEAIAQLLQISPKDLRRRLSRLYLRLEDAVRAGKIIVKGLTLVALAMILSTSPLKNLSVNRVSA
jgi:transposase